MSAGLLVRNDLGGSREPEMAVKSRALRQRAVYGLLDERSGIRELMDQSVTGLFELPDDHVASSNTLVPQARWF